MSVDRDRSMVSHGHPSPVPASELIGTPPRSRAVMVDLGEDEIWGATGPTWVDRARDNGSLVFADVGWDPKEQWSPHVLERLDRCDVFMPNAVEAMAYTGTGSPAEAVYALADRVPVAIVTDGAAGALGIDARTGEEARVPALRVREVDPTGAGDVFGAALLVGTLAEWPLEQRMTFASLCAGLALQQYGLARGTGLGRPRRLVDRARVRHERRRLPPLAPATLRLPRRDRAPRARPGVPPSDSDDREACRRAGPRLTGPALGGHDGDMTELPEDVRDLAALDLYGAQVQDWSIAGDSFSWTLLAGDTHAGHELATVTYVGAVVLHTNRRDLDRAVAAAAEVERSTVAPTEDSGFEHRITLAPGYAIVIRFWSVEVRRMPAPDHLRRVR